MLTICFWGIGEEKQSKYCLITILLMNIHTYGVINLIKDLFVVSNILVILFRKSP